MRVEEIQILAADVLTPPPDLTVSEWADENRRLSSESAAEKGEWRTDRAPYQRAVMDAMGANSAYESVVLMWAAQSGKSSMLENFTGWPGGGMLVGGELKCKEQETIDNRSSPRGWGWNVVARRRGERDQVAGTRGAGGVRDIHDRDST